MWTGRAALYRPAVRPPHTARFGAPPARSPPGFWLVSRAPGTLVIEDACIRVSCGGVDALRVDLTCADVAGVVLSAAEGGGGKGGPAVFAATASYTDSATGLPHALKFAFRLERPDDGPRLAAAWRALQAAAEAARAAVAAGAVVAAVAEPPPPPPPSSLATLPSLTAGPGGGAASLGTADGGVEAATAEAAAEAPPSPAVAAPGPGRTQPAPPPPPPPAQAAQEIVGEEEGEEEDDDALEAGIRALLADPSFADYVARVDAVWDRLVADDDGDGV